jgi:pilus assembly protein CpaC
MYGELGERQSKPRRWAHGISLLLAFGLWSSVAGAEGPAFVDENGHSVPKDDPELKGSLKGENAEKITLGIGEQHVLSAEGVRSYSEGTRGIVDVRLTRNGKQFVLVGQTAGETTLLFIMLDGKEKHLRILVGEPDEEQDASTRQSVKKEDNIRLDFYFVQLDRGTRHQIGLGYPESVSTGSASASFDFLSQSFQSATAVVEDQALLRLDMAQASGWAKLMRKAAVIAENGMKAEFAGGGEVNIPVQGSLTTGIHTISYGSRIEVLPRYDSRSGRLEIELSADVSDLADDRGSGAPGRLTSSISTVVNLKIGQALVLAGLSADSKTKTNSGIPFLSQIPVIGLLFGSERMTEQATDNVIFIVPTVVDATTNDGREQVRAAFDAYKAYRGGKKEPEIVRSTWRSK